MTALRFGLVGTGHWARTVHAAALAASPDSELIGVWGRDPAKAAVAATAAGAAVYDDLDALIEAVDAMAFAVPPDVQVGLAERAARSGRHLLLEKPIATEVGAADRLVEAVTTTGVASIVFFTTRFMPERRAWFDVVRSESWYGGWAVWLGTAFVPDGPFSESPWRREKGGLWDVGPHVLATVTATLGPVTRLTADAGARDVVHLVAHHESGATSTATVTLSAPLDAGGSSLTLWGDPGTSAMPAATSTATEAYTIAVSELVANVRAGRTDHPCDVRLGAHVVRLLADAQHRMDADRS
ncbi:MAG TPA: Gfo/Idh/MocA family oxidoreductase [Nocardioidaceae bacterium]|nr:Gfo/Idh/MocA family oxidoreductase [Nocardioidaceae bacterium]